jgi:Mce-associated membrane protein
MTSDEPVDEVGFDAAEGAGERLTAGQPDEPEVSPEWAAELDLDESASGSDRESVLDGDETSEPDDAENVSEDEVEAVSEDKRGSALQRYLVLGSAGLAAAGLIVATVFGIQWWMASGNDNVALAQAREQVVRAGGIAVTSFIEADYTNLDGYFQRQLDISDPTMQSEIKNTESTYRQALLDSKTKITDTSVLDIAVEELDNHDGKASFLAAVSYVVNQQGQQPAAKLQRLEVQLTRQGQAWKVSGIGSVPTVSSGQ